MDGINIFLLPTLSQVGTVTEKVEPGWNFLIGLDYLDEKHIVTGGHRNVRLYDINDLCVVSTFYSQEVACQWIPHSIILVHEPDQT
jgi:hypothetical protein